MQISVFVTALWMLLISNTKASAGFCLGPSSFKSGVRDYNNCGGSTVYCATTDSCIAIGSPTCPQCDYEQHINYCGRNGDECCNYDCDIDEATCVASTSFTAGVVDKSKCPKKQRYCESSGECIEFSAGDKKCPVCPTDQSLFCRNLGGGQCCDFVTDEMRCTNSDSLSDGDSAQQIDSDNIDSGGVCYVPSAYNTGVRDANKCKGGMNYCESTGKCVRGAKCPECAYTEVSMRRANQYCGRKGKDECCDYDCNLPTCDAAVYSEGVRNIRQCGSQLYCESTDECLSADSDAKCAQCNDKDKPFACRKLGGDVCCDFVIEEDCLNYESDDELDIDGYMSAKGIKENKDKESAETPSSGMCYTLSGYGLGTRDYNECAMGTGMNYCESTGECVRGPTCPECNHDFAPLATNYCMVDEKESCCEYGCPEQEQSCTTDFKYVRGATNNEECSGTQLYCESTGECLSANSGVACPDCPTDQSEWCQMAGGGQCCNFITDECYNYESARAAAEASIGMCKVASSLTGGVNDYNNCIGATEYCATTGSCIAIGSVTCPQCDYDDEKYYCGVNGRDECCDYDCNEVAEPTCGDPTGFTPGKVRLSKCNINERYCESSGECIEYSAGDRKCPVCLNDQPLYCRNLGGGQCCDFVTDAMRCTNSDYISGKGEKEKTDEKDGKDKDKDKYNEVEVSATATFKAAESGVDGTVKVDENGNVFVKLDVSELDYSACDFGEKDDIVLEYAIYSKFDAGDLRSRNGDECIQDVIGEIFNPFDVPLCSEYTGSGDTYFECTMGDLSGRFGDVLVDDNEIVIEGNISEDAGDKEGGFCVSRLTPESLYQRSVVFICKDNKSTNLFCAPFEIAKQDV